MPTRRGHSSESVKKSSAHLRTLCLLFLWAFHASVASCLTSSLREGFLEPPDSARPWVYWFWLNGNITAEGITADLEAMERVGIGGALIMEVDQGVPVGPVRFMSEEWRKLFRHAVKEAERLGLQINMNNDAGWNGSGGPWVRPEESMQRVVWTEKIVKGPLDLETTLPAPKAVAGIYRDIALLAFPSVSGYRIEGIETRALYKVAFVGPPTTNRAPPEAVIDRRRIVDLTERMNDEGKLSWRVPEGAWTLLRLGHTSTGRQNAPSPASGRGLECDKLSKRGIEAHFQGMMAKLIEDVGTSAGKTLVSTHIDSWENGAQNWTSEMPQEFFARRGYEIRLFLPVFTGRVVDSLEISERFLWDLRQTVSELVAENYAGHLRTLAQAHGLRLSIEAYGCPCEDAPYAGQCDEPMAEFWVGGGALQTCKEMSSAAHTYGKRIVGAEAFTAADQERWLAHPATIKALGDHAFCEGVNRFVVHRYALQPWLNRKPGMTMGPWGTHYERTQTWWEETRDWHLYLSRCQYMLRQGLFSADICYLNPEAAPQGFLGHGETRYSFDNVSPEVVQKRMSVRTEKLVLPDGMSYRILALSSWDAMTPTLLRSIKDLVSKGATVVGSPPTRSPSLSRYPQCDEEVLLLASQLWGASHEKGLQRHHFGKGKTISGISAEDWLSKQAVMPEFSSRLPLRHIHRISSDIDIYFVTNPEPVKVQSLCSFRMKNKVPLLWWPRTGRISSPSMFSHESRSTRILLTLESLESVFVVFEPGKAPFEPLEAVSSNGEILLSAKESPREIHVLQAVYGILDDPMRTKDVSQIVQSWADENRTRFRVSDLAEKGDPAPGVLKAVLIEFTTGDRSARVTGMDPDTVHLSRDAAQVQVQKAIYGVLEDPERTRDVTDKLEKLVKKGEFRFKAAKMAEGDDPAFGVVKTLIVDYLLEGEQTRLTGKDPDTLVLSRARPSLSPLDPIVISNRSPGLEIWERGTYEVKSATGAVSSIDASSLPPPSELKGSWTISFPSGLGAPASIQMEELVSLSERKEEGVRHFSGTSCYSISFDLPEKMASKSLRLYLDLGEVHAMARVQLNGEDLGLLWKPPYRMDITDWVKAANNSLEIFVTNLWINRLIGDELLAEDSERNANGTLKSWPQWLLKGEQSPAGRHTFTTWPLWSREDSPPPSGLLGPVFLQATLVYPCSPPHG